MMQRCGDLMQRESQITQAADRDQVKTLANDIGSILEDISRATGSVAHLYKAVDLGSQPGRGTTLPNGFQPQFEQIINECQVVVLRQGAAQEE